MSAARCRHCGGQAPEIDVAATLRLAAEILASLPAESHADVEQRRKDLLRDTAKYQPDEIGEPVRGPGGVVTWRAA